MCQDCYGTDYDDDLGCDDPDDWYDADERDDLGEDAGDDHYDEFKDDVAMGYINPDGSQREPDPPDGYDPSDYRPPLRERLRWKLERWRRRLKRHPDRYDDEPPF